MVNHNNYSDLELIAMLKQGDEAGFTEIYKRYWDKIFIVACNRLRDEAEAEEVVQDVFYSLWKRRAEVEIKYSLNTYLSVAVKYQVINRQARRYVEKVELNTVNPLEDSGVDSTQLWFSERELRVELERAIDKLPEKCKIVFRMSRFDHKSNPEIANELGVTEKNVEAHITRALENLRKSMHISIPLILYLLKK